ncbi:chromosome partitioning protein ParB, partial [Francisella tularensis subsp. holarctica]|uniref:KorB domain-containing protein n=1 Tax=Francisella tularensis TaxID=263 RepID=UPI002381ABE1
DLIENKKVKKSEIAKNLGRYNSWISMRIKIADANADISELSNRGIIDDVRTLYELKKFADEIPQGAQEFVKKALENKISGS